MPVICSGYELNGWATNSGTFQVNPALLEFGTTGVVNVYLSGAVDAWATAGAKRVILEFSRLYT
jgi:hypothetical protein